MAIDMKSVISEALKKLIARGNVDKITVKALIDECHISRQTFYYHFRDIMDVTEWSVQQETHRLVEESLKLQDTHSVLKMFISFVVEQFPTLQKLLNSQRRPQIEKLLVDAMESYLNEMASNQSGDIPIYYFDREILLHYNACGLVGTLLKFGGKQNLNKEKLTTQLEKIMTSQLKVWNSQQI